MIFKKILFIINPISGTLDKTALLQRIEKEFADEDCTYKIEFTKGPSHATDLASQASKEAYDLVVAVGGDGTMNETASGLINTKTPLAILPLGSGNGLSRHLNIPNDPFTALSIIKTGVLEKIDICTANGIPFFNVAGIGYDAYIAHDFAKMRSRGFQAYFRSVVKNWFSYRPRSYELIIDGKKTVREALVISFANGSQFGNNFYISPKASLKDGLLDVCVITKFPNTAIPFMAYQFFTGNIEKSKYSDIFRVKEVKIRQKSKKAHLDGEPFELGKKIHFKVLPQALNILAPKEIQDAPESKHTVN